MISHASYHGHIIPLLVFFLCFVIVAVVIIVSVFIFSVAFVIIVFVPSLLRNLEKFCVIFEIFFWNVVASWCFTSDWPPRESPNFESHMQKCTLVVILSTLRSIGGYRQITLYQRNLMKCWLSLDDATYELSWFESHTFYLDFSCVLLLLFIASVETCKCFVMFVRYYCIRGGLIS